MMQHKNNSVMDGSIHPFYYTILYRSVGGSVLSTNADLQKILNSLEVYSPPLSERKALRFIPFLVLTEASHFRMLSPRRLIVDRHNRLKYCVITLPTDCRQTQ